MPTPNHDSVLPPFPVTALNHASCPPEHNWEESHRQVGDGTRESSPVSIAREYSSSPVTQFSTPPNEIDLASPQIKLGDVNHDTPHEDAPSTVVGTRDGYSTYRETIGTPAAIPDRSAGSPIQSTITGSGFPSTRLRPSYCSSFLRPGSKFKGTQESDKQTYQVEVTIKHVDMKESFLCGFLRIEGLTKDHPTLTTYFEGEMIGSKYTFQTKHETWGATEKTDMQHWERFAAWRPLAAQARKPDFHFKNYGQKENMFMRWKEYFLVPDHRVREISGASFEGFYYICFNQVQGSISGIYFHSRSEKFQQLELKHVEDRGCLGAIEFR